MNNAFLIPTDIMTLYTLGEHCVNHRSKCRVHGFDNFVSPSVFFEKSDFSTKMVSQNFGN